jgi:VWFA-related protein
VRNAHRELVTDLGQGAFTVYENGTAQAITLFRHGDVPVSQGILLDNSRSMRDRRAPAESAALAMLRGSHPQDQTFIMNFADRARIDVPLTSDVETLAAAVHRSDSIGGTALRDAVASAQEYLNQHATKQRKALVVITDGNDNASSTTEDALERQLGQSGIAVYAIGLLQRDDAGKAGRGREALERLADSDGGLAYYPADAEQAESAGVDVSRQIRHVYTIGYAPLVQAFDGSYRRLRVVARGRERLWVKTRPGYRANPGKLGSPATDGGPREGGVQSASPE